MMNDKYETGSYAEVTGSVLGCDINDPDKLYYALNQNKNRDMFVVGSIAIGKTRSFVISDFMQMIKMICSRGKLDIITGLNIAEGKTRSIVISDFMQMICRSESGIITGLDKEEEKKIKYILEANGYTVKIFDPNQKNMENSDTVDFMGLMEDDNIMIKSCASTIMANLEKMAILENLVTSQEEENFWFDMKLTELTFIMLYISTNNENIPKTLEEVYKFICTHDVQEIENIFNTLDDKHPAKQIFILWAQGCYFSKVKAHTSLQILLQGMINKNMQKLTGEQNIDFVELLTKKCVYLVPKNFNSDLSYSYLYALFISVGIQSMIKYYDSHKGKKPDGSNLNKVNVVLDDFCSCGIMPNFDECLSILPSRGIDCTISI